MLLNPRKIPGYWDDGFALDLHTLSSQFLGHDDVGRPQFETTRTELGELLFKLKYRDDRSVIPAIASAASAFIRDWNPRVDVLLPIPPSRHRAVQPLLAIASELGRLLGLKVDVQVIQKTGDPTELKDVFDYEKRMELLESTLAIEAKALLDKRVLLLDDLFRSGATLNAVARLVRNRGGAAAVFALALTRTRNSQ